MASIPESGLLTSSCAFTEFFSTRNVTNTTFEGVEIHFLNLISSF